jgi:hypothetical protein
MRGLTHEEAEVLRRELPEFSDDHFDHVTIDDLIIYDRLTDRGLLTELPFPDGSGDIWWTVTARGRLALYVHGVLSFVAV